jgi:hypothetical protein
MSHKNEPTTPKKLAKAVGSQDQIEESRRCDMQGYGQSYL